MLKTTAIIELSQLYAAGKFEDLNAHPMIHLKPEWALELANSEDKYVRRNLACNPVIANLPKVALALSEDEESTVREALARNPAR